MQRSKTDFTWYGSAGSEGGPFIITSVEDYVQWSGSDEELNIGFRINYYGALVKELAPQFQLTQPVLFQSELAFKEFIEALFNELYMKKPEMKMQAITTAWDEILQKDHTVLMSHATPDAIGTWLNARQDHLESKYNFYVEDKNIFHLEMGAYTDYTRICETALDQNEIAIASFGLNAQGLFWDVRPNIVTLALENTRTQVLFMTTMGIDKNKALEIVMLSNKSYDIGTITLPTGRGVLAWSPMTQRDFGATAGLGLMADLNPPIQLNSLNIVGVGTLFKVKPGTYVVTCNWDQVEDKDFAWIRIWLQE